MVRNVARVRRKSMADVVVMPLQTKRAAAQQENNLSTYLALFNDKVKKAAIWAIFNKFTNSFLSPIIQFINLSISFHYTIIQL